MSLPVVAIVGRPNVGKSSLLNMMARRMISIVDPTAGVTRDRISTICHHADRYFELVDTGGFGIEDHDNLTEHVERQITYAITQAAVVLFVVDIRDGVVHLDHEVARLLRKFDRPVLLIANKADSRDWDDRTGELYALGFGEPICVSAMHKRNREELCRHIAAMLDEHPEAGVPDESGMKLAIVGRRNVGKSTFINALAGQERVIVSEVPGTTRDSVDVQFEFNGRAFTAIDTAGVRKKGKLANSIEFYSYARAERSIRRADVVVLAIDASQTIGQLDKKLSGYIADQYKPCIIMVNKWDLARDRADTASYHEYIEKVLPGLSYAPITFTTAIEADNVAGTVDLALSLYEQSSTRVPTSRLNEALQVALAARPPSPRRGTRPARIYYMTQIDVCPPTLVLFTNNPVLIDETYQRFLVNRFHEMLPFAEVPIRLLVRSHHRDRDEAEQQ